MRGYPSARELLEIAESANVPKSATGDDWCANVSVPARDGWEVVVFYDCGDLDYIDHFVTPAGEEIDFWNWDERNPDRRVLINWRGPGDLKRLEEYLLGPDEERVARELCWLDGHDPDIGERTWRDYRTGAQLWVTGVSPLRPTT